jgi:UPF0489 domain
MKSLILDQVSYFGGLFVYLVDFKGRGTSGAFCVNFLYKDDKTDVYVMDNHLAALWCWMQYLDDSETVNLIHIDRHRDTVGGDLETSESLLDWLSVCPDLSKLSLEGYLSARTISGDDPLFRWDNYLSIFLSKHASQVNRCFSVTHDVGCGFDGFNVIEPGPLSMPENLETWAGLDGRRSIINLDLDYFFYVYDDYGGCREDLFSDLYISRLLNALKRVMKLGKTCLTVSFSPECCGGWEHAERMWDIVREKLDIDFALPSARPALLGDSS